MTGDQMLKSVDDWTVEMVEARLIEAAEVMRRLPPMREQGYFNTWPRAEFADRVGQQQESMQLPPPSATAISRMERTMPWFTWLEPDEARLIWARADGESWKAICWRFGIGRATAHRRWQYGLSLIAWRLNGRAVPVKRSRKFLIERARFMSSAF